MIKRPLRNLTAASILAGATHGAIAQIPMPQTPTTKILAVGTFAPGTDMSQVQRILPNEVRETAKLYLDGSWQVQCFEPTAQIRVSQKRATAQQRERATEATSRSFAE